MAARAWFSPDGIDLPMDRAVELARLSPGDLGPDEFLFFTWTGADGAELGAGDYLPQPYKAYDLPQAKIASRWQSDESGPVMTLTADGPAFFVTATTEIPGHFSESAITLIPGRETRLAFIPAAGAKVSKKTLASGLRIRHLRQTY